MNNGSTKWCQPQSSRLSVDGTTEFLSCIRNHPRVTVIQQQSWDSKDAMCNAALREIKEPCILLQADSDELWSPDQLIALIRLFHDNPSTNCARFFCRYFLGPNIIATSKDGYGNRSGEWLRAWRFSPGMRFNTHEPPNIEDLRECPAGRDRTREMGLVFDHYAYATIKQVRYKEEFYGYKNAVSAWNSLQRNQGWPVNDLQKFLPWVGPGASADVIF